MLGGSKPPAFIGKNIERIHPFQDGNGRVGRLMLFKERLRSGIVPFILGDDMRFYYIAA